MEVIATKVSRTYVVWRPRYELRSGNVSLTQPAELLPFELLATHLCESWSIYGTKPTLRLASSGTRPTIAYARLGGRCSAMSNVLGGGNPKSSS